ncbi:MAG: ribonuclease Z [archaeon]
MTKITFLGTSQAVPTKEKNQTAILLSYNSENILIDCGEGTQRQFKIAGLNIMKINKILITHWHGDHILGLPGLLQTMALGNYAKTLKIYGPTGTKRFIDLLLKLFIFRDKIKVDVQEIDKNGKFLDEKEFYLEAYKMKHQAPCLAYSFIEKDKRKLQMTYLKKLGVKNGPILGKIQRGEKVKHNGKLISLEKATKLIPGKKFSFVLDTLYHPDCVNVAKNADLLVTEACFLKDREDLAKERSHLTAEQAAKIAKKAKAKKLIVTHISKRYDKKENLILKEAKKIFKNTELAKDFTSFSY